MLNFFPSFAKPPAIRHLPLKPYLIDFSLDRLAIGVDNIHFDVRISPRLCDALKKAAWLVLIKHSRTDYYYKDYSRKACEGEKEILKQLCMDVLLNGINKAKTEGEHQIDYLAQVALSKLFLEEIKNQYRNLVALFERQVRTHQLTPKHTESEGFKNNEKLAEIKLNQNHIIRLAGEELFHLLAEIQNKNLRNMRETHFHTAQILPGIFFNNPLLHTNNPSDDFFLIEEYVLFGKRAQDHDSYNNVKSLIYSLLSKTDLIYRTPEDNLPEEDETGDIKDQFDVNRGSLYFDRWIMETGNIDLMFNCFDSQDKLERVRRAGAPDSRLWELRKQIKNQQRLLDYFYRSFRKAGLIKQIVPAFEMRSIYGIYCPPVFPRQFRKCLVSFWSRRSVIRQLKHRRALYGTAFPQAPLVQAVIRVKETSGPEEKQHLLNYLREFSRYHRDLHNSVIMKDAMETINLVTEERTLQLSRKNRSLYEFLLPAERVKEEKPVSNHVIIKADIRGSMNINHTMRARGLNPASHFSLNFFDPISEILRNYNATKVFIEGDAIILSIFENKDTPQSWYGVARACGLAIKILQIVQRYNIKNQENNLPVLELGIGICFTSGPPLYLFDGGSRIMISPAINMADRLSGCSKKVRKLLKDQRPLYNLYVYKNCLEVDEDASDDSSIRYNVNGIELNEEGFVKLSREINLNTVAYKGDDGKEIQLHTGKVPILNGGYQQLAIREAPIYEVNPETLAVTGETSRKYYEICTNQEIYDYISCLDVPLPPG
ncbi:MAG: hypothetical protein JW943_02440 [Deltaproteobacteria bacterium]|nr:hypothetical protein [Deltaproteobacteria bacterium]